jgi:hypothetical protein
VPLGRRLCAAGSWTAGDATFGIARRALPRFVAKQELPDIIWIEAALPDNQRCGAVTGKWSNAN